ncbi:MAG: hypothetical protein ACW96X_10970 [Promethearchaeota archaeon]|jgi:hypothetical protein
MTIELRDSEIVYIPEDDFITCPVADLCILPKHGFLCKVPDCKTLCPEYLTKVRKLPEL